MKIGIIGYRNFAAKLSAQFLASGLCHEIIYYHPSKIPAGIQCTNEFDLLFDSDAIVVASPDFTHGEYLRKLNSYKGYIFCEKIPVITNEDLEFLLEWSNPRLYFNFMLRKSIVSDILKENKDEILNINIIHSHGLAFKDSYADNWRNNFHRTPMGVLQVSGIHFFDLLLHVFGEPKSLMHTSRIVSPMGRTIDNFSISMEFDGKIKADLFFSYTAPYQNLFNISCMDKLFRVSENDILEFGPRNNFDSAGRFIPPKIQSKKSNNFFEIGLKNSVLYFLDVVKNKGKFFDSTIEANLLSTKIFLSILKALNNKRDKND